MNTYTMEQYIFREDIPMDKLSTIEQTFISRAETNKTWR